MRVAIALGSGGARGFAHIGVLRVLAARGYEVVAVSGTSAGAVAGGMFAAGKMAEFEDWVSGLTQLELLSLLDPTLASPGVIRAQRWVDRVTEIVGDTRIEELPIPFVAVATDLLARREVWFEHGPLLAAFRASIAIPSVFTPVKLRGRLLVDGGLMNPVPIDALSAWPADVTIAVDLNGREAGALGGGHPVMESADMSPSDGWLGQLRRSAANAASQLSGPLAQLTRRESTPDPLGFEDLPRDLRTTDVLSMSLNASQALVTRFRTAANPPDVWVSVPVDSCPTLDFLRGAEMIELGQSLTESALDAAGL